MSAGAAGAPGRRTSPLAGIGRRVTRRVILSVLGLVVLAAVFRDQIPIVDSLVGGIPMLDGCTQDLNQCVRVVEIGFTQGMIIALIALGYTLVYGILQLINFANGDVFMLGSAITLMLLGLFGITAKSDLGQVVLAFVVIFPVTMIITAVLNASIERVAYRPLRQAPTLATLISAIGMSFVLQNVGQKLIGVSPVSLPISLPTTKIFELGPFVVQFNQLFVSAVTIPLLVGLVWFVRSTRQGKAMRATAQDREAAGLMGIDVNRTIGLTFLLAGALAGGAGVVVALFNGQAWWFYGFPFGLLAFTAAVFGGIGNLTGAALGGILLGIIISLNNFYIEQGWQDVMVFSILVLVLIFRPTGLLGETIGERA